MGAKIFSGEHLPPAALVTTLVTGLLVTNATFAIRLILFVEGRKQSRKMVYGEKSKIFTKRLMPHTRAGGLLRTIFKVLPAKSLNASQ